MGAGDIELVVARYTEDLSWLCRVPLDIPITVYDKSHANSSQTTARVGSTFAHTAVRSAVRSAVPLLCKGPARTANDDSRDASLFDDRVVTVESRIALPDGSYFYAISPVAADGADAEGAHAAGPRTLVVKRIPNVGREADTYLHHIISNYGTGLPATTIFCQGHPFDHSPDFLQLLGADARRAFRTPVQPLTDRYNINVGMPPQGVMDAYPGTPLTSARLRVAAVPYSTHTLDFVRLHDHMAKVWRDSCVQHFGLQNGHNIIQALFDSCGIDPRNNPVPSVSYMCFGAIFSTTRDAIMRHDVAAYKALAEYNKLHRYGPYILERAWLQLFGFIPLGDELPFAAATR